MLPINAFSIENFKSFGPKQRLPLSRINFLFGPNSHGKSSSLLALALLMNGYLKKNFGIKKISHLDNSPDIRIDSYLNNKHVDSNQFIVEAEYSRNGIYFSKLGEPGIELPKLNTLVKFYLESHELCRFQAFEVYDDDKSLIIDISSKEVKLNTESSYLYHYFARISEDDSYEFLKKKEGIIDIDIDNVEIDISTLTASKRIKKNSLGFIRAQDAIDPAGEKEKLIINEIIMDLLFTIDFEPWSRSPAANPVDWIGPNRSISSKSCTVDGEKDFIEDAFLNKEAINKMNKWLSSNTVLDLGYNFILNESKRTHGNTTTIEIKEFGVQQIDSSSFLKLSEVGSGIGHIFQILIPLFNKVETLIIQQPEIHLHPSLQVQLARAIFELSNKYNIQVILETHSEHIIKAAQLELAKNLNLEKSNFKKDDLSVLYISKDENGFSTVKQMDLDETGAFTEPWPDDFFELSADLTMERLRNSFRSRN